MQNSPNASNLNRWEVRRKIHRKILMARRFKNEKEKVCGQYKDYVDWWEFDGGSIDRMTRRYPRYRRLAQKVYAIGHYRLEALADYCKERTTVNTEPVVVPHYFKISKVDRELASLKQCLKDVYAALEDAETYQVDTMGGTEFMCDLDLDDVMERIEKTVGQQFLQAREKSSS